MSGDGQKIVFGYNDGTIQVWDVETGIADSEPLPGHERSVYCVAISADGRTVVSCAYEDETVRVWALSTEEQSARRCSSTVMWTMWH